MFNKKDYRDFGGDVILPTLAVVLLGMMFLPMPTHPASQVKARIVQIRDSIQVETFLGKFWIPKHGVRFQDAKVGDTCWLAPGQDEFR